MPSGNALRQGWSRLRPRLTPAISFARNSCGRLRIHVLPCRKRADLSASVTRVELDELREIGKGGKDWIARYQAEEIARTEFLPLRSAITKFSGITSK